MISNKRPNNIKSTASSSRKYKRKKRQSKKICILLAIILLEVFVLIKIVYNINSKNKKTDAVDAYIPVETQKSTEENNSNKIKEFTVFIDPGHGFSDGGTESPKEIGYDLLESEIALDMGLKLEKLLKEKGMNVILSRKDNYDKNQEKEFVKLSYEERVNIANTSEVDIFISLHIDALDKTTKGYDKVNGYNIYYYDNDKKKIQGTKILADCIKKGFADATKLEKVAVKEMNDKSSYYVVNHTIMPSILFELGYCTNKEDAERLASDNWRNTAVKGITDGIIDYYNKQKDLGNRAGSLDISMPK